MGNQLILPNAPILRAPEYRRLVIRDGVGYIEGAENPEDLYGGFFAVQGGAVPGGAGAASSGYNEAGDIFDTTIDGIPLNDLWDEFQQTLQMHNGYRREMMALLGQPISNIVEPYWQGVPDDVDFEEATEYGEPVGIRTPEPKLRGYPLRYYDLAIRYTWRFLAEASADQIRALNNSALEKDLRLQYQTVMQALFNNVNGNVLLNSSMTPDGASVGHTVTVFRLFNADGEVPNRFKSYTHSGSHTHYLASGGATVTPANLELMEDHLVHHGHKSTGKEFVLLVNRQESKVIQGFRIGVNSASYDFIPSALMATRDLITGPQASSGWVGSYGHWLIKEEDVLPPGYMLGVAVTSPDSPFNLVGVREHPNAAVRGLKLIGGNRDSYPLINSFYHHAIGAGVADRGAAVVMKVTAGAYSIPTFA